MPFCRSCGSPVEGQFCGKCGTPLVASAPGASAPPPAQPQPQAYAQPVAAQPAAAAMADNVASTLCYIVGLITGILFLVLAPYNQNKTIRFHAFQSIFFNVTCIAVSIVGSIVMGIIASVLPYSMAFITTMLGGLIWLVVWVGALIVWIMLMVKAYSGQKLVLPIIGPIAEKQA